MSAHCCTWKVYFASHNTVCLTHGGVCTMDTEFSDVTAPFYSTMSILFTFRALLYKLFLMFYQPQNLSRSHFRDFDIRDNV